MINYECQRCRVVIQSENAPNQWGGCAGDGIGNHAWNALSKVGGINFVCKKCKVILRCDKVPALGFSCSAGGTHEWRTV